MEELRQVQQILTSSEVTQDWLCSQARLLADLLWKANLTTKERVVLHSIALELKTEMDEASKASLPESFKLYRSQCGELLKLYSELGLAPNVPVLAKLLHQHLEDGGSLRGIRKIQLEGIDLESQEFPHEVVFLWENPDVRKVLAYLKSSVLDDKSVKSPKVVKLYRDVLKSLTTEAFVDLLFVTVQRQLKRSPLLIEHITELLSFITADLSSVAAQLYHPAIHDHIVKAETRPQGVKLLDVLVKKCSNLSEVASCVCGIRATAEPEITANLLTLKALHGVEVQPIVSYCLDVSPRLRSDESRAVLYDCFAKHVKELTPDVEAFLKDHCTSAKIATLYSQLGATGFSAPTKVNTLQLTCASSVQLLPNFVALCRLPESAVFNLPHISQSEELCLVRALRKLADTEPLPHILQRIGAGLLSRSEEVRKFVKSTWIDGSFNELATGILGAAKTEEGLKVFEDTFKTALTFLIEKVNKADSFLWILRLLATAFNRTRIRWAFSRFPQLHESSPAWLFDSNELDIILVATGQAESYMEASAAFLELEVFEKIEYLIHELEVAPEEPSTQVLSEITTLAKVPIQDLDQVPPSQLRTAWIAKLEESTRKLAEVNASRLRVLSEASLLAKYMGKSELVLPYTLQLEKILQLQSKDVLRLASTEAIKTMLLASQQLAERAFDFAAALRRSVHNGWSEKLAEVLFDFAENKVDVAKLTLSEVNAIEVFLRWVLKQPASGVRQHGLALLTRLVQAHKYTSLVRTLSVICTLLRNYSPPALAKLFPPLLDIIKPIEWRPIFGILLELQLNAKKIVLDSLDQYPHVLPHEPWCVAPLLILTHDESREVVRDSHHVLHKFKLGPSLEILLEGVVPLLLNSHEDGQKSAASTLSNVLTSNPEWTDEVIGLILSSVHTEENFRGFEYFIQEANKILEGQTLALVSACFINPHPILVKACVTLISSFGSRLVDSLFSELQTGLERGTSTARLASVILLGTLAQFLPRNDLKIDSTIDMLFSALNSDDEGILKSVASSLPHLISYRIDQVPALLDKQQERLYSKNTLPARRGAAYGIAAVIKGAGLRSLVRFNVMERMEKVINTRKSTIEEKGGVLLLVEGLSAVLGRGLEPYLGELLPFVIENFSDNQLRVQADRSIKQVLTKLSAHGIKCMLPLLNVELEDSRWQTKVGAVEAMGRMAYSASRQLANCLPTIVPQVMNAFQDTQHQVIEAATRALNTIASVVTNPEISQVVPQLIRALQDVSSLTTALKTILATAFAHYLDAASLALIIPIVETGLKSRDSEVKKLSCHVVGTLYRLLRTPEELHPYLKCIVTAIRVPLLDSIPDVRFVAAQSLGSLCYGMKHLGQGIEDWMIKTMHTQMNPIERAAATHSYSELLLLNQKWEGLLDTLTEKCLVPEPYIRESHLGLFIFIPNTASDEFEKYLERFLPIVVENLCHPLEEVRKVSQRVMKVLISTYSGGHLTGLLSPLEVGLFDSNWHTRYSCLQLIAELLEIAESTMRRTGVRPVSDEQHARVLSAIYVLRCDHASNVHTLAVQTWKNLVDNTPKMLTVLTSQIVMHLLIIAQRHEVDLQEIASKSIENLVFKYQDRVFSHYLNFFKDHIGNYPRGVAVCLSTACKSASPQLLTQQSNSIMQILQPMLMGDDKDLNNAGGVIFQLLYTKTSEFADPKFLNSLLDFIGDQTSVYRQLLRKPSLSTVVARVVPFILKSKYKDSILNEVADLIADDLFELTSLYNVFPTIVRSYAKGEADVLEFIKTVAGAINDISSLGRCIEHLELMKESPSILEVIVECLQNTELNVSSLILPMLQLVLPHMASDDQDIVTYMPACLRMIADRVPKEEHAFLLNEFYEQLNTVSSVPFFNFDRGLDAILILLMNSLMYGRPELKAMAARSYRIVIEMTEKTALSAYVVQLAGPLIRVMNERVSHESKVNILQALRMLVVKGEDKLKPFTPQLQSTFMKALQHTEAMVRVEAKDALLELLVMNPHIEMLVNDLLTLKGDTEIILICLDTLENVLKRVELAPNVQVSAVAKVMKELPKANESIKRAAAKVICRLAQPDQVLSQLQATEDHANFALYYIPLLPNVETRAIQEYIGEVIDQYFSIGVGILREMARTHPNAAFKYTVKFARRLSPLISECLGLLRALPSEDFIRNVDNLQEILPALAFGLRVLIDGGSNTEDFDNVIIHIFKIKDQGLDNVLRALHLLPPETQAIFRRHVEELY